MSTFVFGDVHGMLEPLKKAVKLFQSGDTIIGLGDYVDRGEQSFEVIELLLELEKEYNCIWLKGNHDDCFFKGLHNKEQLLYNQGARETIQSYREHLNLDRSELFPEDLPINHYKFFKNLRSYYILDNKLFVHGGFNRHYLIDDAKHNSEDVLVWDRDLIAQARSWESMRNKTYPFKNKNNFDEIFVGHTFVQYLVDSNKPQKWANINLLDTGCGYRYLLTVMDVNTKEYWQY